VKLAQLAEQHAARFTGLASKVDGSVINDGIAIVAAFGFIANRPDGHWKRLQAGWQQEY